MYEFQHLDPVILRLIDEGVLSPTREEYAAKVASRSSGEIDLLVRNANATTSGLEAVALEFFWNLA